MKKISKSDLKGLTEMFQTYNQDTMRKIVGGLSVDEWEAYLLGYLGDQGATYTDSNGNLSWHINNGSSAFPYSQNQFDNWNGSWYGGWVQGWGYVAPEAIIYGSNIIPFNAYGFNWNGEGIGVNASCSVSGNVTINSNSVFIMASMHGATLSNSGISMFGIVELKVDGTVVARKALAQSPNGYYTSPGNFPLGEARFDLSSYRGSIEITIQGAYNNNNYNGTGVQYGSTGSRTIYSTYR